MASLRWNATIVDAPDSDPVSVIGDLVVAVRTPRSRDFVTVEVAPRARCERELARPHDTILSRTPYPSLTDEWHGEVRLGAPVEFRVAGEWYRLTLARLAERDPRLPWITCDFCLERD